MGRDPTAYHSTGNMAYRTQQTNLYYPPGSTMPSQAQYYGVPHELSSAAAVLNDHVFNYPDQYGEAYHYYQQPQPTGYDQGYPAEGVWLDETGAEQYGDYDNFGETVDPDLIVNELDGGIPAEDIQSGSGGGVTPGSPQTFRATRADASTSPLRGQGTVAIPSPIKASSNTTRAGSPVRTGGHLDDTLRMLEDEQGGGARGRWLVRVRDGEVEAYEINNTVSDATKTMGASDKADKSNGQEEEVKGDDDVNTPPMSRAAETMGEYALLVESELGHIHRMICLVTNGFVVGTNSTSAQIPAEGNDSGNCIDGYVDNIHKAIQSMVSEAQEAFVE